MGALPEPIELPGTAKFSGRSQWAPFLGLENRHRNTETEFLALLQTRTFSQRADLCGEKYGLRLTVCESKHLYRTCTIITSDISFVQAAYSPACFKG